MIVALFVLGAAFTNTVHANEANTKLLNESETIEVSIEVTEAMLLEYVTSEIECSCMLEEGDPELCQRIGKTIGVLATWLTDWDDATIKKLEKAVTDICMIWTDDK